MDAPPPLPSPAASLTEHEARTQRHLGFLDTLIAHGMDLATRLHQQSTTPSDLCSALAAPGVAIPFITPDVIASFEHISRTVRRAILVARKLAEPLPPARPGPQADRPVTPSPLVDQTRTDIRAGAGLAPGDNPRPERAERAQCPGLEDRIGARPIPEIIAGLCRDLDVNPDSAPGHHEPNIPQAPDFEAPDSAAPDSEALDPHAGQPPGAPQPPTRPTGPSPVSRRRIQLPADDAEAVAMVLRLCSKPARRPPRP